MMSIHEFIPEDCQGYINGHQCDFRTCPYIHSAARREEVLQQLVRQGKIRRKYVPINDPLPMKLQRNWRHDCEKEFNKGKKFSLVEECKAGYLQKCSSDGHLNYLKELTKSSILEQKNFMSKSKGDILTPPFSKNVQQKHKSNHVQQPHLAAQATNKLIPESRALCSQTSSSKSEISNLKAFSKTSASVQINCEFNEDKQSNLDEFRKLREDLSNWDPERLKWINNLSLEKRNAYLGDLLKNKNNKPKRSNHEAKPMLAAESKSLKNGKFHLFTNLPAEIRNQIWEYAKLNSTSTCHILLDIKQEPGDKISISNGKLKIVPNPILDARFRYLYHVPGMYGACKESRSFVKNLYGNPKMVAFNQSTQQPYPSGKGTCILNFEQDRVFFISCGSFSQLPEFVKFMRREERNQIKHLAIPFRDYFHENITVIRSLVHFPNLQTLDLVLGEDKEDLKRIGNKFDYSDFLRKSLQEQHMIEDGEYLVGEEQENNERKKRRKWSIPRVKTVFVSKTLARAWKIDGFRWETTSKSIPPRLIEV
ncbi:hypothetical protein EV44_g1357 [Erysiphe necator]|uniref:2EXR domain-containing protein n=1 Tax=Uncinula necator TaxID=52586 RepID=A0A0B1P4K0_UNCNE|nr:hypothetical protein EV44_g1357 [Erysiphe necator]